MASQHNNGSSSPIPEPELCANNCGFYGTPQNRNLCSKCYSQLSLQEHLIAMNSYVCPSAATASSRGTATLFGGAVSGAAEVNRCGSCNKKVRLTGFVCKCGITFCGVHRYPEKHECTYDFKTAGREAIFRENPLLKADKIQRF